MLDKSPAMTTEESYTKMALGSGGGDHDDTFPLLDRLLEGLPDCRR